MGGPDRARRDLTRWRCTGNAGTLHYGCTSHGYRPVMPVFRARYVIAALLLFMVEAAIALFVHDAFVRPHVGDAVAVMLVHCALRAVTRLSAPVAALCAFAIAVGVELSQYAHLVDRLGLGDEWLARTILGTGFDWRDFVAYATGVVLMLLLDRQAGRA